MVSQANAPRASVNALPPPFQMARKCISLLQAISPMLASQAALTLCSMPMTKAARTSEKRILEGSKQFSFQCGGYRINGYRWGQGPRVILAHGWNASTATMTPLVAPLVEKGCQVVALDAPGHGKSSGWLSDMRLFGNALARLLDESAPLAIVAHSFGAAAALLALEKRVDLQPRLVLLSASNDAASSVVAMGQALGLREPALRGLQDSLARRVQRPLHEFIASNTGRTRTAPTLVVHDVDDVLVPVSEGRDLAKSLSNAVFWRTEGLGHNKILRDAGVIARVVKFVMGEDQA